MKVLVCGSTEFVDKELMRSRLSELPDDVTIIEGEAPGADSLACEIAEELGYEVDPHPAQWDRYGRAAGPIRNSEMLEEDPDLVIAFHWDLEESKGTADTVRKARKRDIPVDLIHGDEDSFEKE